MSLKDTLVGGCSSHGLASTVWMSYNLPTIDLDVHLISLMLVLFLVYEGYLSMECKLTWIGIPGIVELACTCYRSETTVEDTSIFNECMSALFA